MAVAALAAAALVVGCGGSDEGIARSTMAKPEYLESLVAICNKTYDAVKVQYEDYVKENGRQTFDDPESVEKFAGTVLVPARKAQTEEVRQLGALEGDEEKIESIVTAYEEGIAEAEEDPENAVKATYGPWVPATELVKKYGAEDCDY